MNRRQFITTLALACGAGCSGASTSSTPSAQSITDTRAATRTKTEASETQTATPESEQTPTLRERDVSIRELGNPYAWSESFEIWVDRVDFTRTMRLENGQTLSPSTEMAVLEAPVFTVSTIGETESLEDPITSSSWMLHTDDGRFDPFGLIGEQTARDGYDVLVYDEINKVYPVETSTGSLLFEVPRTTTKYSLVLIDDETDRPIVAWSGAVDATEFPQLTVTEINAFAQRPADEVQVSMRIENGESQTEFFYPTVSIRSADGTTLVTEAPTFRLHPTGSTTLEYTVPVTPADATELQVELSPSIETTVPIVSVRKSWMERYMMANGVRVSLFSPMIGDKVPVSSDGTDDASEPQRYLSVDIHAYNPTHLKRRLPALEWFELEASATSNRLRPLERSSYDTQTFEKIYSKEAVQGTLYFSVPETTFATGTNCRGLFPLDSERTEICEWGPVW